MLVSDVMSTQVDYVTTNSTVKDIARIIFGRGINGVPVVDNRKLVGFVTERDILSKFYPSVDEYMEDPVNTSNFESMEAKISNIFSMKASKVMSTNPIIVTPDTPLLKAQSLMFINSVGRLPVVDHENKLVGIVAQGDIFRSVVGDQIPLSGEEEYHDWVSRHYDLTVEWGERLGNEIPELTKLFREKKVTNVLDILSGTGEHDIALAQKGFNVTAMEKAILMHRKALVKLERASADVKKRVEFLNGDYVDLIEDMEKDLDAVIFMGNAFPHLKNPEEVLSVVSKKLSPKGIMFFQINNFERILKIRRRFLSLTFAKAKTGLNTEFAFLEFYDPARSEGGNLNLNMAVFDYNGKTWKYRSMNSTPIANIDQEVIKKMLSKAGFRKITFYGGDFSGRLFEKFDDEKSYYLNVLAER